MNKIARIAIGQMYLIENIQIGAILNSEPWRISFAAFFGPQIQPMKIQTKNDVKGISKLSVKCSKTLPSGSHVRPFAKSNHGNVRFGIAPWDSE